MWEAEGVTVVTTIWQMSGLDLAVLVMFCLALGFVVGIVRLEYKRTKEADDAGSSGDGTDLHMYNGTGSVCDPVGSGRGRDSTTGSGD